MNPSLLRTVTEVAVSYGDRAGLGQVGGVSAVAVGQHGLAVQRGRCGPVLWAVHPGWRAGALAVGGGVHRRAAAPHPAIAAAMPSAAAVRRMLMRSTVQVLVL